MQNTLAANLSPGQTFQYHCKQYRVAEPDEWKHHSAMGLFLAAARKGKIIILAYSIEDRVPCSIKGDETVWIQARRRKKHRR